MMSEYYVYAWFVGDELVYILAKERVIDGNTATLAHLLVLV